MFQILETHEDLLDKETVNKVPFILSLNQDGLCLGNRVGSRTLGFLSLTTNMQGIYSEYPAALIDLKPSFRSC